MSGFARRLQSVKPIAVVNAQPAAIVISTNTVQTGV